MIKKIDNHYKWLDRNFPKFLENLGRKDIWPCNCGIIRAHGDKCSGYRSRWENEGIPFEHGVAIYLLSYIRPWEEEVRETKHGWVAPVNWVVDNYARFKPFLEKLL